MYTVIATVKSIGGECAFHRVGDQIIFNGRSIQGQFCPSAFMAMMPTFYALRYGVEFPWLEGRDVTTFACPDAENPVVFEIQRIQEKEPEVEK
jgi:uncharacterized repeat protein (TIGR04076 family)